MMETAHQNFKEFKTLEKRIPTQPYYEKFGSELEKRVDLEKAKLGAIDAMESKIEILRHLQSEITKEIAKCSKKRNNDITKKPVQWDNSIMN